ncbi:unnamed protein product [Absidia cylindrospora]
MKYVNLKNTGVFFFFFFYSSSNDSTCVAHTNYKGFETHDQDVFPDTPHDETFHSSNDKVRHSIYKLKGNHG